MNLNVDNKTCSHANNEKDSCVIEVARSDADDLKAKTGDSLGTIIFAVSFYIVTSIVMVMVNKAVLNSVSLPITFLWLQLFVAVILLRLTAAFNVIRLPLVNINTCKAVMPLITINVLGLTLNTLCLQFVDASFFQVARSLVLPFTVVLTVTVLRQSVSSKVLLSCAIVFAGFTLGTFFEDKAIVISTLGVVFGVLSSLSTATHAIVIKQSLDQIKGSTLDLVYYNNLLSAAMLFPIFLVSGEIPVLRQMIVQYWSDAEINSASDGNDAFNVLDEPRHTSPLIALLLGSIVTGFFGFLINIAGFFQIKVTSPISHMISSAFRGVLQTGVAYLVFGDIITMYRMTSISLILLGSCAYVYAKSCGDERHSK